MTITGTRFGEIDFGPSDVLFFKEGLIGFPNLQEFVLVSHKEESPFRWLQSVQEPSMAFLCAFPQHFIPEFNPNLSGSTIEALKLAEGTDRYLLTTASIPSGKPNEMTLNLAAPILVNAITRGALQFVLDDEAYTVKHRVFPEAKIKEKVAA
jgi:flagellar assembly factor FliW